MRALEPIWVGLRTLATMDGHTDTETEAGVPSPFRELTKLRRDIIMALDNLGTATGAELLDALQGEDAESTRGIYPVLDELQEDGLVEKRPREPDNRSNSYALTERGERARAVYLRWTGGLDE